MSDLSERVAAALSAEPDQCGGWGEYSECAHMSERHEALVGGLRTIIWRHTPPPTYTEGGCRDRGRTWPCPTLMAVAAALGVETA